MFSFQCMKSSHRREVFTAFVYCSVSDGDSHEVVTRYDAGPTFVSDGSWSSDANCREMQTRRRNFRPNWDVSLAEPVAGNYFPTSCLLRTTSLDEIDFVVAIDRAQGSTSLENGQLELMGAFAQLDFLRVFVVVRCFCYRSSCCC